MKKTLIMLLTAVLILSAGCASAAVPDSPVRIATLAGPTGMGLIGLIGDDSGRYEVEILSQPDQISPKIINGEVDIATIPSNLAAVLYNKMGGGISVFAVNTTGVLYLVSGDESVKSIADLAGRDVVLTGQGATPEYIYNKVLSENNISANTTFLPSHSDLSNAMAAGETALGVLPEPFVSITLSKNSDLFVAVDFNAEWRKIYGESSEIPMGVAVVSDAFAKNHPEALERFIADYKESVAFVNGDIPGAAAEMEAAGLFPKAAIAEQAIPRCGVSMITGEDAKAMLEDFFEVLFLSNPKSIGGEKPDEAFYVQPKR